jgi:hypothetical protein
MRPMYPYRSRLSCHLKPGFFSLLEKLHQKADPAHNFKHINKVAAVVARCLTSPRYDSLSIVKKNAAVAAAYLHEVDDPKLEIIFPTPCEQLGESKLPIANSILRLYTNDVYTTTPDLGYISSFPLRSNDFRSLTLDIINLVSTRTNHNTVSVDEADRWMLLVRDVDRCEAIGDVGIARCYAYTKKKKMPLFTASTSRCRNVEELWQVATPERFARYEGRSESMIDHYYDKLLHLNTIGSGDPSLMSQASSRMAETVDFVLGFGRDGTLDVNHLESLARRYC